MMCAQSVDAVPVCGFGFRYYMWMSQGYRKQVSGQKGL